jgi:hypothetical protein
MTPPAASAAGRALPRTAAPRAPRRVSGPAPRRRGAGAPSGRRAGAASTGDPFVVRTARRGRLLADSRLLDRLIRGRLWVPLVAAGLMGIVFMQVTMLKFNSGIGRAVQTAATLERQNDDLRSDVSRMEAGDRIDTAAKGLGMVVPADGGEHYVRAGASDTAEVAVRNMKPPAASALAQANAAATATTATTPTAATTPATTPVATPTPTPTATTAATPTAPVEPTTPVAQTETQAQTPPATQTPTPTPAAVQQQATAPAGATTAPPATTAAATSGGSVAPSGN